MWKQLPATAERLPHGVFGIISGRTCLLLDNFGSDFYQREKDEVDRERAKEQKVDRAELTDREERQAIQDRHHHDIGVALKRYNPGGPSLGEPESHAQKQHERNANGKTEVGIGEVGK